MFVTARVVVRRCGAIDAEDTHARGLLVGQVGVQQQRLGGIRKAVRNRLHVETAKVSAIFLLLHDRVLQESLQPA